MLWDLHKALALLKESTEADVGAGANTWPLTFEEMRQMCGIPTLGELIEVGAGWTFPSSLVTFRDFAFAL